MTAPDEGLVSHLRSLEVALARRDLEAIPGGVEAVLDAAFVEYGSSGRTWRRDEMIRMLATARSPVDLEVADFALEVLADDVALATYRLRGTAEDGHPRSSLRSSLWVRRDGRWRMRFHQGTHASE